MNIILQTTLLICKHTQQCESIVALRYWTLCIQVP